mmetsp:Transcript_3682/g.9353  ORF Transcript_3682/g.9353 Transcript_3682/m.9353 type:complete len:560 (+) Transcript_3682:52-1731(+)
MTIVASLPIPHENNRGIGNARTSVSPSVSYYNDALPSSAPAASPARASQKSAKAEKAGAMVRSFRQLVAASGPIGSHIAKHVELGSGSRRLPMEMYEAQRILEGVDFYREWDATIQQRVPHVVTYMRYPAGTPLFVEGELPGNCFYVMSGRLLVLRQEDASEVKQSLSAFASTWAAPVAAADVSATDMSIPAAPAEDFDDGAPACRKEELLQHVLQRVQQLMAASPAQQVMHSRSRSVPAARRDRLHDDDDAVKGASGAWAFPTRHRAWSVSRWQHSRLMKAAEGQSIHRSMDLGPPLEVVSGGSVVGEQSLLKGQARACSVVCAEDCDCLVIHREEFDRMLKKDMRRMEEEKQKFLMRHVPGLRDAPAAPSSRINSAMQLFTRSFYPSGFKFLMQGHVAKEEAIYVIADGRIEFTHIIPVKETAEKFPTKEESISKQHAMRSPRVMHSCAPSLRRQNVGAYVPIRNGAEIPALPLSVLVSGALFGSLPLPMAEPFTVQAARPCQLYVVTAHNVAKLPAAFSEHLREYLAIATKWRLERLSALAPTLQPSMTSSRTRIA